MTSKAAAIGVATGALLLSAAADAPAQAALCPTLEKIVAATAVEQANANNFGIGLTIVERY